MTNLDELLKSHEGKTLEFKRDLSSPDPVMKTVVAFANSAGGELLIGVEDTTHNVRGLSDPTKVEETLANLICDRVEPRLVPDIQIIPWRKTYVLAVRVFPSASRPHYIKSQGLERGTYVRVGSTNRKADPAQIDELRRFVRCFSFDEEPLPDMNSEAIDFRAASECFASVRKLKPSDMQSLQLTVRHQHRQVPTVGGVLLFGVDQAARFPDAYLRAGCFAGKDKTKILDSVDIKKHLPLIVDEALHFVKRNTQRSLKIEGARHVEAYEFPLIAVREALMNALVHADYAQSGSPLRLAIFEDRIEIDNPGGLAPGLTLDDLRRGVSKLRNRVIGRVFHELGLIEQWGSGIQRMTDACLKAGLPAPLLEEIGSGFRVTLYRTKSAAPTIDELDQAIIAFVEQTSNASTKTIAEHIGRTSRSTRTRLSRLVESGLLVAVGSNARDPLRIFQLPGRESR